MLPSPKLSKYVFEELLKNLISLTESHVINMSDVKLLEESPCFQLIIKNNYILTTFVIFYK